MTGKFLKYSQVFVQLSANEMCSEEMNGYCINEYLYLKIIGEKNQIIPESEYAMNAAL